MEALWHGGSVPVLIMVWGIGLFTLVALPQEQREAIERLVLRVSEFDRQTVEERLEELLEHPLDLRLATGQDLVYLGITPTQRHHFFAYQKLAGPLISLYELQVIPEWSMETITGILPFVKVEAPSGFWEQPLHYQVTLGTSPKNGRSTSHLLTRQPLHLCVRLLSPGAYELGLVLIKQSGEKVGWVEEAGGFHPGAYHLYGLASELGPLRQVIVGSYQVGLGHGLLMSATPPIRRDGEALYLLRPQGNVFKPVRSRTRQKGLMGLALKVGSPTQQGLLFLSSRARDAPTKEGPDGEPVATSWLEQGLAYTHEKAWSQKDQQQEQLIGVGYLSEPQDKGYSWGMQAVSSHYGKAILPKAFYYNKAYFSGKKLHQVALFGEVTYPYAHFFFEGALCAHRQLGSALLAGALIPLKRTLDLTCVWRDYSNAYHNPHGGAFSKNTHNRNERGCYLGMAYTPTKYTVITGYADFFMHPNPQYRLHRGSYGRSWLLQGKHLPDHDTQYMVRLEDQGQHFNDTPLSTCLLPKLRWDSKRRLTLRGRYRLTPDLIGRSEAQLTCYRKGQASPSSHYGIALSKRLVYKPSQATIGTQLTLFANDWETRSYLRQYNGSKALRHPLLYGKGFVLNLLMRFPLGEHAKLDIVWTWHVAKKPKGGSSMAQGLKFEWTYALT